MQTVMSGTVYKPVPLTGPSRRTNGPMTRCRGVVLHVNAAYSDDLYDWITKGGQMSCHFQVNLQGKIYQYIPIDWTSWCQSAGNAEWISIETSGQANELLNVAQIAAVNRIWDFCRRQRNLANTLAENPNGYGFGWHGMGAIENGWKGPQWGHFVCPGVRRPQRQLALNYSAGGGDPATPIPPKITLEEVMPHTFFHDTKAIYESDGQNFWWLRDGSEVANRMFRLKNAGCKNAETGEDFKGGADVIDITKAASVAHLGFVKGNLPSNNRLNLDNDGRLLSIKAA